MKRLFLLTVGFYSFHLCGMQGLRELSSIKTPNPFVVERVRLDSGVSATRTTQFARIFDNTQQLPEPLEDEEFEQVEALTDESFVTSDVFESLAPQPHEVAIQQPGIWRMLSLTQRRTEFGHFAENVGLHTVQQTGGARETQYGLFGLKNWTSGAVIPAVYRYLPQGSVSNKKNLIILIHGTWSQGTPRFVSDQAPTFKAVLNYAELGAHVNKQPVDVVSFAWSSFNDHNDRMQGAQNLAQLLDQITENYQTISVIGHSHGCNVINIASHKLKKATINTAIYFACPVRERVDTETLYRPTNKIETLYNFYSFVDKIQMIGSVDVTCPQNIISMHPARIFDSSRNDINVFNIATFINNKAPGHTAIMGALGGLYDILKKIRENYQGAHSFLLHVEIEHNGMPTLVLVALADNETHASPAQREYSDAIKQQFQEIYEQPMSSVTWGNWAYTL